MEFKPPETDSKKRSKIIPSPITPVTTFEWKEHEFAYFATITTGLEEICCRELLKKLKDVNIYARRGKIIFSSPDDPCKVLREIRSIDRIYALLDCRPTQQGSFEDQTSSKQYILDLCNKTWKWKEALSLWCHFNPTLSSYITDEANRSKIKFRATCKRGGRRTKHIGKSPDIATIFGYEMNEIFGWTVDLVNYDLETYLHINDEEAVAGIFLGIIGQRNEGSGKGYLKPPVAFCMTEVAEIKPGETVLDPMCGTGMITVEATHDAPFANYIASDLDKGQLKYALNNFSKYNIRHITDILHTDARDLPLPDHSVDKIISDIPFGKRHGTRIDNKILYPALLREWHRILKTEGICVLLTTNTKIMSSILVSQSSKWEMISKHFVNLGGLDAFIYKLKSK